LLYLAPGGILPHERKKKSRGIPGKAGARKRQGEKGKLSAGEGRKETSLKKKKEYRYIWSEGGEEITHPGPKTQRLDRKINSLDECARKRTIYRLKGERRPKKRSKDGGGTYVLLRPREIDILLFKPSVIP